MSVLPRAVPTSVVVRSVASAGTNFADLKPFEFGIFDEDTHLALSTANVNKRRVVYMGVGSPNQRQFTQGSKFERLSNPLNADINFRSQPVTTSSVDEIHFATFKKTEKPNIYYLGYNGIDSCEGLKFECGKTYSFNVVATGRPVRNIFGNDMRELITIDTDCCSPCTTGDCDLEEPCQKYIDKLVAEFNDPNRWLSRFFVAEKVITCGEDLPALTRTTFVKYTLTVCDNGDELALSAVQNAYPTYSITVKSRQAPYTTYEVIKTSGLPSAFSQSAVVLQNCATCPSGYTATAAGYAYIVDADNALLAAAAGANTAAKLSTLSGVTVSSATAISTSTDHTLYSIVGDAAITSPSAGLVVNLDLGIQPAKCTGPATTTAWVAGDSVFKVQRDLCLTVKPDDCDADFDGADAGETLARLTALYANHPLYVSGSLTLSDGSTDCLLRYSLSQYCDNYLTDGCDTTGDETAIFSDMPAFEGQIWTVCPCEGWDVDGNGCPVPPTPDTICCQCGIKFTGRPTTYILDDFPGYDIAQYLEKEPIELSVTPYYTDADTNHCDYDNVKWLQVQHATFRQLKGSDVVKRIIKERFYNKEPWVNQTNKEDQLLLRREGIKLGINIDEFYYQFGLTHNTQHTGNVTAKWSNTREDYFIYVNENDLATMNTLKGTLAAAFPNAKLTGF